MTAHVIKQPSAGWQLSGDSCGAAVQARRRTRVKTRYEMDEGVMSKGTKPVTTLLAQNMAYSQSTSVGIAPKGPANRHRTGHRASSSPRHPQPRPAD